MVDLTLDSNERCAKAVCHWPSTAYPHLTDGFSIEVYQVHGGWYVSAHYDVRTGHQWGFGRRVETQAEGAPVAADLWTECVRLMLALHRGEPLRHPGDMMRAAWEASKDAVRLREEIEASHRARAACLNDDATWREARLATDRLRRELEEAAAAWFARADWRDYRDRAHRDVKPANVGQGQLRLWAEVA